MNKAKLKVLVQALKEIVDELESEVYADEDVLAFTPPPEDYDESFEYEDNDAFPN